MAEMPTLGDLLGTPVVYTDSPPLANQQSTMLGVTITFITVSWICVVLRLYTRFAIVRAPGWDDLFVGLYLLTTTTGSVALMVGTKFGLGKHLLTLTPSDASSYLMCFYIMNASYTTSTACIKISLLLQYLRIFDRSARIWKLCFGLIVFTFLWGFAYSFMAWFPCFPVYELWAVPRSSNANCYAFGSDDTAPFAGTFESHAAVNVILDLLVLAIPIPLYFEKDTPSRMRWSLLFLLFLGFIVNFLSLWRFVTVVEHRAATFPDKDPTWYAPISLLLAALEIDIASICASVPIFWPVLQEQLGKIFITQEVQVTREERWTHNYLDDRSELTRGTDHSGSGSEAELNKFENSHVDMGSYEEAYVMGRWDPITGAGNAKATVKAGGGSDRQKWWKLA